MSHFPADNEKIQGSLKGCWVMGGFREPLERSLMGSKGDSRVLQGALKVSEVCNECQRTLRGPVGPVYVQKSLL